MSDWETVFSSPGTWVGVSHEVPAWVGRLTRNGSPGFATLPAEELSLEVSEMTGGMASAWGAGEGWPAFQAWLRALAQALGGRIEFQTFRRRSGEERHEARYMGESVEI